MDREKLVELLMQVEDNMCDDCGREPVGFAVFAIADHLITNGVTVQDNTEITDELLKQLRNAPLTVLHEEPTIEVVQEWISVKDRLPEPFEVVIVYDRTGKSINWAYMTRHHEWVGAIVSHVVTHWMPLPQPPKGEKETIFCKDCEHLMFSDCYGECAKGYKGIVQPNDTCEHARRKPPKGE